MSPPSPEPPQTARNDSASSLRQSARKRLTLKTTTPAEIQATSASIYSHNQDEEHSDDDEPRRQEDEAIEDEDDDYPHPDETSLLPPPNFQPFFTLITDPVTRETHHPHVYYVFSDDAETEREGSDVATVASLRALDQTAQQIQRQSGQPSKELAADDEIEERFVILDLEPATMVDGTSTYNVRHVSSLSPAWAVTSTGIGPAPTFEEDASNADPSAFMLRLEGIELDAAVPTVPGKKAKSTAKSRKGEAERRAADLLNEARKKSTSEQGDNGTLLQGMDEIWRGMNDRMGVLDKVLGQVNDGRS
jgi:hypothetical protein